MMVFALDVPIPKGEWVKVLNAGESANLRLKSNREFFWAHSVAQPDYEDCSRAPEKVKKATIVATPADVWVCYSANSNQIMTVNNVSDAKFGE